VAAGTGVSLIPMAAASAEGCRVVPLHPESFQRIGYAHIRRHFRPAAQKAFIDWLRGLLPPPR